MPIQNKAKAVKGIYYHGKKIVKVYNRGVLSWKGGEGYTMYEWIENNSSAAASAVDLGIKSSAAGQTIECKFRAAAATVVGFPVGASSAKFGNIWFYFRGNSYNYFAVLMGTGSGYKYSDTIFTPDTDDHTVKYVGGASEQKVYHNGTLHSTYNYAVGDDTDSENLCLFNRKTEYAGPFRGRIYYLKVSDTETGDEICNLVPCKRNADGAAGFWDTVREEFFTNTYWTAHNETT